MSDPYYDLTGTETEADFFSRIAAAYVQDLAPVPDPEPDDYADMAAAAEYLIYNYLTQTSGASVRSEGVSGISSSYVDFEKIKALVAPVMGPYYEGSAAGLGAHTGYIEDLMWR